MFCKNCGEKVIRSDADFCPNCGALLKKKAKEKWFLKDGDHPNQNNHWQIIIGSLTGFFLLFAIVASWWLFLRPVTIKKSCASKTANLYQSIIKAPAYASYTNGSGGLNVEVDHSSIFADLGLSSGQPESEQLKKEIEIKDSYFSCLKNRGL